MKSEFNERIGKNNMARLGKYSGRIYEENEVKDMQECGICITDELAQDEDWISKYHVQGLMECIACCGCPLAQKGIVGCR